MNNFSVLLLLTLVFCQSIVFARRQVSSRDWQEDEREYEVIPVPKLVWSCDFERHDCDITNDAIVGQYFRRSNTQISRSPKRNMLLLNITQIESNPSGARLITPYMKSSPHSSKGCLTIEYFIGGNGIKNLVVYQQEVENRCIWSATTGDSSMSPSDSLQKVSLTVDLKYGDPRYFIESHFDNRAPNFGFVAISEIQFFDGGCNRNDANKCIHELSDEPEDTDDYPNDLP